MHCNIEAMKQVFPIFPRPTGLYPNPFPVVVDNDRFLFIDGASYILPDSGCFR